MLTPFHTGINYLSESRTLANQTDYIGVVPTHNAHFGDLSFEVGFVLAALLYALFFKLQGDRNLEEALVIPDEPVTEPAA